MCCFVLLLGFLGPRVAFLAWWIFGDKIDIAWDSWYLAAARADLPAVDVDLLRARVGAAHHVSGAGWLLVAIGVFLDIASYASRSAKARFGTA